MACEILVPGPEIKSMSSALAGRFLTTGPPGKSPYVIQPADMLQWAYTEAQGLVEFDFSAILDPFDSSSP